MIKKIERAVLIAAIIEYCIKIKDTAQDFKYLNEQTKFHTAWTKELGDYVSQLEKTKGAGITEFDIKL